VELLQHTAIKDEDKQRSLEELLIAMYTNQVRGSGGGFGKNGVVICPRLHSAGLLYGAIPLNLPHLLLFYCHNHHIYHYHYQAAAALHTCNWRVTVAACDACLRLQPENIKARARRAEAWQCLGELDYAEADLRHILSLHDGGDKEDEGGGGGEVSLLVAAKKEAMRAMGHIQREREREKHHAKVLMSQGLWGDGNSSSSSSSGAAAAANQNKKKGNEEVKPPPLPTFFNNPHFSGSSNLPPAAGGGGGGGSFLLLFLQQQEQ